MAYKNIWGLVFPVYLTSSGGILYIYLSTFWPFWFFCFWVIPHWSLQYLASPWFEVFFHTCTYLAHFAFHASESPSLPIPGQPHPLNSQSLSHFSALLPTEKILLSKIFLHLCLLPQTHKIGFGCYLEFWNNCGLNKTYVYCSLP